MTTKQEQALVNQWITFFDKYVMSQVNKRVQYKRANMAKTLYCTMKGITASKLEQLEVKHIQLSLRDL